MKTEVLAECHQTTYHGRSLAQDYTMHLQTLVRCTITTWVAHGIGHSAPSIMKRQQGRQQS